MITVATIAERNTIADQVLAVANGAGGWDVYQTGDALPAWYLAAQAASDDTPPIDPAGAPT